MVPPEPRLTCLGVFMLLLFFFLLRSTLLRHLVWDADDVPVLQQQGGVFSDGAAALRGRTHDLFL